MTCVDAAAMKCVDDDGAYNDGGFDGPFMCEEHKEQMMMQRFEECT
jgi:hypothetical protein